MVNLSSSARIWKIIHYDQTNSGGPNPYQSPGADQAAPPAAADLWPLFILFGSLYFVPGIVEPTAGMIAQPN